MPKLPKIRKSFSASLLNQPQVQQYPAEQSALASPMALFDLDLIEANATQAMRILETQQGDLQGIPDERTFAYSLANILAAKATHQNDAQAERLYNKIVSLLATLVTYFRHNPSHYLFYTTDEVEIWLLSQLLDETRSTLIQDDVYNRVVDLLHDEEARRKARRQALVIKNFNLRDMQLHSISVDSTWYHIRRFYRSISDPNYNPGEVGYSDRLSQIARAEQGLEQLWLLSATRGEATAERLKKIASVWDAQPAVLGQGPAGKYYRTDDARHFFITSHGAQYLGNQWAAGWEKQAAELKRRSQTE